MCLSAFRRSSETLFPSICMNYGVHGQMRHLLRRQLLAVSAGCARPPPGIASISRIRESGTLVPPLHRSNSNVALRESKYKHRSMSELSADESGIYFEAIDRGAADWKVAQRQWFLEHLALRDLCRCSQCVDQSTQQRHYSFASIPENIRGKPQLINNEVLEVRWENDVPGFGPEHVSHYDAGQIVTEVDRTARLHDRHMYTRYHKWNAVQLAEARAQQIDFNYPEYMLSQDALNAAVEQLVRRGIIFVRQVPFETDAVKHILERIGPLRNTFYGETWDVRSVQGAANVAYTARDLGFHQDLLYMENPPGLQALHVMRASASGGESLFADGARAIDWMLATQPAATTDALFRFPVTYRYKNAGEWYEFTRPTLEGGFETRQTRMRSTSKKPPQTGYYILEYGRHYSSINWSPPFQGPFTLNRGAWMPEGPKFENSHLKNYRRAAALLQECLEHPDNVYETRMEPGTCVIFNNRRIMHARKAFPVGEAENPEEAGQERWLRGAYGDLDPLMSRFRKFCDSTELKDDLD